MELKTNKFTYYGTKNIDINAAPRFIHRITVPGAELEIAYWNHGFLENIEIPLLDNYQTCPQIVYYILIYIFN
jgi:hypothetical protein